MLLIEQTYEPPHEACPQEENKTFHDILICWDAAAVLAVDKEISEA